MDEVVLGMQRLGTERLTITEKVVITEYQDSIVEVISQNRQDVHVNVFATNLPRLFQNPKVEKCVDEIQPKAEPLPLENDKEIVINKIQSKPQPLPARIRSRRRERA